MPRIEMGTTTSKPVVAAAIEELLLEVIRELLKEIGTHAGHPVSLHSSFDRDLGLGSLERVELLVRCETRFNTHLPDEIAQQADTPAEWLRALVEGGAAPAPQQRYRIEQPTREAPRAPDSATTWVEVLRRHAEIEPDRVHIHLLEEDSGQDITYSQLLERASMVAAGLAAAGLRPNETVAIMLPTCGDFFYAFYGVMLAGGIAVPIYPPARPDKIEEYVRRQVAILQNAEVRFLITFDQVRAVSRIMRASLPSLSEVTTVGALRETGARLPTATVEPSETGFIQYTSGSTGEPKGVVLSHANILANVRGIGWAVQVRPTDVVVTWLPLYHDMGLIGSWLFSVYYALPITILSPLAFLRRPERWLWALHDSRGTLCPAPNFAFELCARKIADEAIVGLDLSSWRVAINAGEAVLPETLERFAARFKSYGFRPESYVPCYGLAESSVALTFPPINRRPVIDTIRRDIFEKEGRAVPASPEDPSPLRFAANGKPLPEHEIQIRDEEGRVLGERVQGRLFFRGLSMTSGYFRNPEATAAIVTEGGWMDSGDLAYWADGEAYITGRSKDLIIKAGRNIVPQEVEGAAAEVAGVRRGCVAAFGTMDPETGTERMVIVAETRARRQKELRRIKAEIIRNVANVLGIPPDKIELVPPQCIPKTSSGKIRRSATRSLYLSGELRAGRRAPWVQIVRLTLAHLGSWTSLGVGRTAAALRRIYASTLLFATAALAGSLVRLVMNKKVASRILRPATRLLLRLTGHRVNVHGHDFVADEEPVVFVANRAGRLDPLLLVASLPRPFLIADATALASLPWQAAFMLKPLVIDPIDGEVAPPGGTLRQRIRRHLEEGHSVLIFPEGPTGIPAHLSRFRLDAFHAAGLTSRPIQPIGLRGTSSVLEPGTRAAERIEARVNVGLPIRPRISDHRELVGLRERVREALTRLCD